MDQSRIGEERERERERERQRRYERVRYHTIPYRTAPHRTATQYNTTQHTGDAASLVSISQIAELTRKASTEISSCRVDGLGSGMGWHGLAWAGMVSQGLTGPTSWG
jgi:hypothetical protein